MPNTFLDARDRWIDLSEIDYLGHFVRAWLAFNAWYRSAYTDSKDRVIIDTIKWQPNPIRSKLLPLLTADNTDGAEFRASVGLLHERLESYRLETGRGFEKAPITFRNVYLKTRTPAAQVSNYMGWSYEVKSGQTNGSVVSEVKDRRAISRLLISQQKYDLAGLEAHPDFTGKLNANQQGTLRGLYINFSPRVMADVTARREQGWKPLVIGAVNIECPPQDLFAAICEVIYQMRCALFHGELIPTKDATACYEPAYRIVRRFIGSIT